MVLILHDADGHALEIFRLFNLYIGGQATEVGKAKAQQLHLLVIKNRLERILERLHAFIGRFGAVKYSGHIEHCDFRHIGKQRGSRHGDHADASGHAALRQLAVAAQNAVPGQFDRQLAAGLLIDFLCQGFLNAIAFIGRRSGRSDYQFHLRQVGRVDFFNTRTAVSRRVVPAAAVVPASAAVVASAAS